MLDFIVYMCGAIITLSFLFGLNKGNEYALGVATAFLVIVTIGLFTSGWETYSAESYNINYNAINNPDNVTPTPLQIRPVLGGTAEQQTIYGVALLGMLATLMSAFLAFETRRRNVRFSVMK